MIGEHPDLIGLPETNIFRDDDLGQMWRRYGRGVNWPRKAGLLRTIAYFHDGAQTDETIEAAERFVSERSDWSYVEIANYLVKIAAPYGIVEKSVSTCRDPATLARVREAWPNALYIHVTRQPESIVNSMQARVDRVFEIGKGKRLAKFLQTNSVDEYYTRYTSQILEFMGSLPQRNVMNLRGEDFLTDARPYAKQICEWAGIDSSDAAVDAMMHPENNPFAHTGPEKAPGGMSASFIENPQYSGKPVSVKELSIDMSDPTLDKHRRKMALLGYQLGYT